MSGRLDLAADNENFNNDDFVNLNNQIIVFTIIIAYNRLTSEKQRVSKIEKMVIENFEEFTGYLYGDYSSLLAGLIN